MDFFFLKDHVHKSFVWRRELSNWLKNIATSCPQFEQGCSFFCFFCLCDVWYGFCVWHRKKWTDMYSDFCEGKQTSLLYTRTSRVFWYTSKLKNRTNCEKIFAWNGWNRNLPRFHGARSDHVRVESLTCCFHRKLFSFDPWHVTHSLQSSNRTTYSIWGYNIYWNICRCTWIFFLQSSDVQSPG